ncbi:MAG: hypothetical protein IPL71_21515 [Anaerolineales bacterium]|nr:hypothetical protein [Anaerolineales bacterium]
MYLALRDMDWEIFFNTLKNAQYAFLPIIFLWSSASFLIRALRLRVLLTSEKEISIFNVFGQIWRAIWATAFFLRARVSLFALRIFHDRTVLAYPTLWRSGWWND